MPKDTLWLDHIGNYIALDSGLVIDEKSIKKILNSKQNMPGVYFAYDNKNTNVSYSLIKKLKIEESRLLGTEYEKEKAYYDTLGDKIVYILILGFFAVCYYAYKSAKKYKQNPFDDYSDWIEIGRNEDDTDLPLWRSPQKGEKPLATHLTYHGKDLNYTKDKIATILNKRFPFFSSLNIEQQNRFINRVKLFLKNKNFKIHDKSGFNEMPILISASAIQLSFGLPEYLLPNFKNIHIFPKEFLGLHPTIRFLVGNVSDNNINISWKHLLDGYDITNDGHNVALHEFAHAYYLQYFVYSKQPNFVDGYNKFLKFMKPSILEDALNKTKLFSTHARENEHEFWAECVELYFEKPKTIKEQLPNLYNALSALLNPLQY